ncbi:tetratricopeptide repeat protein [Geobacter pickeringii]|uniref:Uncharacterized protein n=1 Tax=Geobacter pickeringii TaxID=345632 RepID=A0A0B5B856_9BACT|nr:tetratricopeptide repeat protein [Geobacter pickeringii]AJE02818.1 hypothetical protein GPICK_05070 [Geobacter pickeringii]
MTGTDVDGLVARGIKAANGGNTTLALECLEQAVKLRSTPVAWTYLAYCLARERQQVDHAIRICEEAIRKDPRSSSHYLNLGRIHLLAGRRTDAIRLFRQGMLYERNPHIEAELRRLGLRKPPLLGFLGREHPLNKYLGIILAKLRLR